MAQRIRIAALMMSRGLQCFVLLAVLAGFGTGLTAIFKWRLERGDVFPAYSTLRADPQGLRALQDAVATLPNYRSDHSTQPLTSLDFTSPTTLVLAGLSREKWSHFTRDEFSVLDLAVRNGSRLIISLDPEHFAEVAEPAEKDEEVEEKKSVGSKTKPAIEYANLEHEWNFTCSEQSSSAEENEIENARLAAGELSTLPQSVTWRGHFFFHTEREGKWKTIYRHDGQPAMIERTRGRGTIVIASDSFFLSNEALQRDRSTPLLIWIIGANRNVVFDESHLGIIQQPGIAALARRYGLTGAAVTLILFAILSIWQRSAQFVAPIDEPAELTLTYQPTVGLQALLRRAVTKDDLLPLCCEEWIRSARPSDVVRLKVALASLPSDSPLAIYNGLTRSLCRK